MRREVVLPAVFKTLGLPVAAQMAAIRQEDRLDEDSRKALQFSRLCALVQIAAKYSRAYREIYREHGFKPSDLVSWDSIHKIPIVERKDLQQFSDRDVLTDQGSIVSRRQTTGTTGQPLRISLSREAYAAQLAARFVRFEDLGIRPGDREARFWGRLRAGRFAGMKERALGRRALEIRGGSDDRIREDIRHVAAFRPDYFYGYASMLVRAAQVWADSSIAIPPLKAIVSTAETLHPFQREMLRSVFQCPVVNEYGSSETDIIAFECPEGRLHLETHNVLLESLNMANGQRELVVTNLQNRLMPLIRYRIGDSGEVRDGACRCGRAGPWLDELRGRTDAQLIELPNGETRHCVIFAHWADDLVLEGIRITRFRASQDGPLDFTFKLEITGDADEQAVAAKVRQWTLRDIHPEATTKLVIGPIALETGGKFTDFVALSG